MTMNILITGAGLIGSNAARHAVDAGHKVVLFDLSPNRDYIQKVVGKDKADVVAADMRDLPALLSALEKFNVDTLVHYRRIDRRARPRKLLHRRDQQYSRHDQCSGSCAIAKTQTDRLCQHLRRLRSRQDQRQRRSAKPTRSAGTISTPRRKSAPSISFTPMPACITSTRSSFARAAFSAAVFTSAAPRSARSCAIWRST